MGKVLLGFSHAHACDQVSRVADVPVAKVSEFFNSNRTLNRLECGQVSTRELYDEFCDTFGCRPDYDAMTRAGSDIFCLNTEIVPLIAQMSVANVRMGILSNTCEAHWELINDGRYRIVSDYFEVIALSYKLGAMKPDRTIYEQAAELANVEPNRIFFTDDLEENVRGAQEAGWSAVQFESVNELAIQLRECGLKFNY